MSDSNYGNNRNERGFAYAYPRDPSAEPLQRPKGPNKTSYTQQAVYASSSEQIEIATGNEWRTYLNIQNRSSADVYVAFGIGATSNNGFVISAGGFLELDTRPPNNKITALGTVASQQLIVIEGYIDEFDR